MADIRSRAVQSSGPGQSQPLGLKRFRRSLGYAWNGLTHAFRQHPNLRLELALLALCLLLSLILEVSPLLVLLSWGLVLCAEVINTAIELVVDLISPTHNELAGLAKDVSAAAVLLAALTTAAVNAVLLLPPLLQKIGLVNQ